eukprot:7500299-Prorocentrum_lima.AAC.1
MDVDAPDMDEDHAAWLSYNKTHWRKLRAEFKEEKKLMKRALEFDFQHGKSLDPEAQALLDKRQKAAVTRDGVAGFLENASLSLTQRALQ